jgi:hypothetical protein
MIKCEPPSHFFTGDTQIQSHKERSRNPIKARLNEISRDKIYNR